MPDRSPHEGDKHNFLLQGQDPQKLLAETERAIVNTQIFFEGLARSQQSTREQVKRYKDKLEEKRGRLEARASKPGEADRGD